MDFQRAYINFGYGVCAKIQKRQGIQSSPNTIISDTHQRARLYVVLVLNRGVSNTSVHAPRPNSTHIP